LTYVWREVNVQPFPSQCHSLGSGLIMVSNNGRNKLFNGR